MEIVQLENIKKNYGDVEVLKGINLTISKGEIACITGTSGAGKTTLLQIIGTLLKSTSGNIKFNKYEVSSLKEKDLSKFRNQYIGFVFQFHHLLPEFTSLENVCIPAFVAGKSKKDSFSKAKELLKYLKLEHRMDHKPAELSGGEQQRVAVARALINQPELLLADEPSGNLDTENKTELHKLFFDLRKEFGTTILIVTHDNELARMSDRIINLKDGLVLS